MATADERRAEALRVAYDSARDRLPASTTFDEFSRTLSSWVCHPILVDGAIVGAVLVNGPELHACITPSAFGRWLTRGVLRLVDAAMERFGYAMTRAHTDVGRRFVLRLGFTPCRIAPEIFLKVNHGH